MELPISAPGFEGKRLVFVTRRYFKGPRVQLDGVDVRREKRRFFATNNAGQSVEISIKPRFLDPIPNLVVGGNPAQLAPALVWQENVCAYFPLVLVFNGGVIGALVGTAACMVNMNIFRSARSPRARYLLSGLVFLGALAAYVVIVVPILILLRQ